MSATNGQDREWRRVRATELCPICGHDSWCAIGQGGILCMRTESPHPAPTGAGWIHFADDRPRPLALVKPKLQVTSAVDWAALNAGFRSALTPELCGELATLLGVSSIALEELGVGHDGSCWTWPMYGPDGAVCGIKTRDAAGGKRSVRGSKLGVFRRLQPDTGMLAICEGESDTASAISLGLDAIGVSGSGNAVEVAAVYGKGRDVVIIADRDEKGAEGAEKLRKVLQPVARSVRSIRPPEGHKDLRAWLNAGATWTDLDVEIAAAAPAQEAPRMRLWSSVATDPPVAWLVDGLIPRGGLVVLAGEPGAGKTLLALDIALRCSHGMQWLGRSAKACSTLYLAGEGSHGLGVRLRAWRAANSASLPVVPHYVAIVDGIPNLTKPTAAADLESILARSSRDFGNAPDLVVVDTLAMATPAADENDSGAVGAVLVSLADLRQRHGCAVIVLHHVRKPQPGAPMRADQNAVRGSSAVVGSADVVLLAASDGDAHSLRVVKSRDGEVLQPLRYLMRGQDTGMARDDGSPEFGPVVCIAPDAVPVAEVLVWHLPQAVEDNVRKIGHVVSGNAAIRGVTGRRQDLLDAWKQLLLEKRIVDVGTTRDRNYVVSDHPSAAACQIAARALSPQTPPVPGTGNL